MRFQEKRRLHNTKAEGKAASADAEAAESCPEDAAQIMMEGGCAKQQISHIFETALYCKKMLSTLLLARKSQSLASKFPKTS